MNRRALTVIFLLALGVLLLLPLGLLAGGVSLSVADVLKSFVAGEDSTTRFIVIESRLPALLTAVLTGTALSVSGL
ncbi:MAG: iron chelate uptake ABC transporter family permease subunit, partial [Muribaculaceae bacterium]|nr:iron chelate uptake ABC transporter family permease subunit [Muribaculaceae bacterium]